MNGIQTEKRANSKLYKIETKDGLLVISVFKNFIKVYSEKDLKVEYRASNELKIKVEKQ